MKIKRVFGLILTVAMAISLLAGCGGGKSATGEDEGVPKDSYEIQWYYVSANTQADVSSVEAAVNDYLQDKINATLKLNCLDWGTYNNKMNTMIAAGTPFDIVYATSSDVNYDLNALRGAFVPLNDYMDKYLPKTKEALGDDFLNGSQVDGINYALPMNKEKAHQYGFVYRKDIAEKYEFDMSAVKNIWDLEPYLQTIKEKEKEITPLGMTAGNSLVSLLDFVTVSYPGVFYPDKEDGKIFNMVETPEYLEILKLTRNWFQKGYLRQDVAITSNSETLQMLNQGQFFSYIYVLKPGKDKEMSATSTYELKQIELTPPRMANNDVRSALLAISRTSKDPIRVMRFLELLYSDKTLSNLLVYGIEGKHYTKIDDNTVSVIKNAGYSQAAEGYKFGNVFLQYLTVNDTPDKYENFLKFNEAAIPHPSLGFTFDVEPVKSEATSCINIREEFIKTLQTGSVDPDETLPKLQEKLKQAGVERLLAEMQRQYDVWKENN